ncbi:MAG: GTP-binding protein [Magnetococcus sp. WYHC-3]
MTDSRWWNKLRADAEEARDAVTDWAREVKAEAEEARDAVTDWAREVKAEGPERLGHIWRQVRQGYTTLVSADAHASDTPSSPGAHLDLARQSLRDLLGNTRVPEAVRSALARDYQRVQELLERVDAGRIHIAVFGRVSVGKSALLNALLGEEHFSVSPLHGETKVARGANWSRGEGFEQAVTGGVVLIDTPGINEIDGETRERLAHEVAAESDLVVFVVDGDLTDAEHRALVSLHQEHHSPVVLVLNKADRYSSEDRRLLLESLARHGEGKVQHVLACAARPAPKIYLQVQADGSEQEIRRTPPPDVAALKDLLWSILEREGKTLAAYNATLFAGRLSARVAQDITKAKGDAADQMIRKYAIGKGVAVGLNPIAVVDMLSVAADVHMVVTLGKLYGLPLDLAKARDLLMEIIKHMGLLMGTVFGVQAAASLLKGASMGLSTVLTAGAQGAVGYYGIYMVGQVAKRYFAQGGSWGEGGAKGVVKDILASVDRDSILAQARSDIQKRLSGEKD